MADSFTNVDLSQLPVPNVVEQIDFEAIVAAMLADMVARFPEFSALVESDPLYKIVEVCAYRETLIRQQFNERAKSVMLAYAAGSDLDNLAALFGVSRLVITPADPVNLIPAVMESDSNFRYRITLAPEGYSVAGPEGAYIFHALSASADVLDASATSPNPGDVVVTVLGRSGDGTAAASLLATVAAAVSADNVRPMTDNVTVQSATIVDYTVAGTLYTFAGPDSGVVIAASLARLTAYTTECHRLGRDVTMSGLYAALHSEGVQRVVLTAPTADVVTNRTQAAYCTAVNIVYGGLGE